MARGRGFYLTVTTEGRRPEIFTLYVNNEFECFIKGSKHDEKTL